MKKALTRRQFIKSTAGTVAGLGVTGFPLSAMAETHCLSCGALIKQSQRISLIPLGIDALSYCPNCGVSLRTHSHEIECSDYEHCVSLGVAICGDPIAKGNPCFLVPFPNRRFLEKKNQSQDISALKF